MPAQQKGLTEDSRSNCFGQIKVLRTIMSKRQGLSVPRLLAHFTLGLISH